MTMLASHKALEAWVGILRDKYSVVPRFVHTDKDMAEIGASRRVWPEAKHQLSVYNTLRAVREHAFINVDFKPYGRVDPSDMEGGVPVETQIPSRFEFPLYTPSQQSSKRTRRRHAVSYECKGYHK